MCGTQEKGYSCRVNPGETVNLVVTSVRRDAARYMEKGWTLFAFPAIFGQGIGYYTLYRSAESKPVKDGIAEIEALERKIKGVMES